MTGKIINYTNRDFDSFRKSLYEYAKQYYPEVFKDFSEASFGAMIFDAMSYVGDNLSFYIDFQANEIFLDTAQQLENITKLARERGYRDTGKPSAFGPLDIYLSVPATSYGEPDRNYFPILKKNSTIVSQQNNASYLLLEDRNFATDPNLETVVATVDSSGIPLTFAIKSTGKVVSGGLFFEQFTIETFQNFLKLKLSNPLLSEIISVTDSSGNEYYQVDYLSQNIVYKFLKNTGANSDTVPYILGKIYAPRRFVIENIDGFYHIIFGNGSTDSVSDPRNIILEYESREFISERKIDPKNIIQSDKFGIAPNNTTLTVTYRANNSRNMGVSVRSLNKIINPIFEFPNGATNQSTINSVISSIEVENPEPISSVNQLMTAEELRRRAFDAYSSQYRAVTKDDYIYACYSMDPRFGSIKRANIVQDTNSFKRNLNLFVIGEDSNGHLVTCPTILKENLKQWLLMQKMINDTIDILDVKIINLGIEFVVDTNEKNKEKVQTLCINKLIELYETKFDIGESFSISSIYKALNSIQEVIDTKKVKITLKSGGIYSSSSFDIYSNISTDGSYIECPADSIFEIKFTEKDIKGTVI